MPVFESPHDANVHLINKFKTITMTENVTNREAGSDVIVEPYLFRFPDEAMRFLQTARPGLLNGLADVYKEAFAGDPWYERFTCPACDCFSKESCCPTCGKSDLPQAYPEKQLIEEYFPSMLTSFSPSVLTVGYKDGKVVGFCTGGITDLLSLIERKYKGSTEIKSQILDDICERTGLPPWQTVFYENEACILPSEQRRGIGTQLSTVRMATIISHVDPDLIFCGRSINPKWLQKKEVVFSNAQTLPYRYFQFAPRGDTFAVGELKRMFYMGIPLVQQNRLPNYMVR